MKDRAEYERRTRELLSDYNCEDLIFSPMCRAITDALQFAAREAMREGVTWKPLESDEIDDKLKG
jgi:hypothetical protein